MSHAANTDLTHVGPREEFGLKLGLTQARTQLAHGYAGKGNATAPIGSRQHVCMPRRECQFAGSSRLQRLVVHHQAAPLLLRRRSDGPYAVVLGAEHPEHDRAGPRTQRLIRFLAVRMDHGGLAEEREHAARLGGVFSKPSHAFHQAATPMRRIDHGLAELTNHGGLDAKLPKSGHFKRVVTHHLAGQVGLRHHRHHQTLLIQRANTLGDVEILARIRKPVSLVHGSRNRRPVRG